ncbi:MAG TPA: S8 family serine peptidase, partial [Candidatus Desulfaltia sp.]|nr:S8 family serine peptidase [Candidatus Desulfaltia sp.]
LSLRAEGPRFVPGQVLIRFKPSLGTQLIEGTLALYGTETIKRIPQLNVYQVKIPAGISVEEMTYALSQNPDVDYAGPNYIARIAATPNDRLFRYQYALHNTGQDIGAPGSPNGKDRADIRATAGWEETKGEATTIIAIVDSGIDFGHPDLKNKIVSGGRDFVNDDWDATDDLDHGTFVAGIAAAETNNNEGMAGVAWNCKILPVKVLDAYGIAEYINIAAAIIWAADNGAQVINLSLGGDAAADALRDALRYAYEKGVVVVAAAGNYGAGTGTYNPAVQYPAAYDAYCLAVAATDYNDTQTTWSCFGPEVDVAAPGDSVLGTYPTYMTDLTKYLPYAFGDGTSASAPHVAGLAALLKGLKPWLSVDDIMNIIRFSADDVNSGEYPGRDNYIGYGRINMEKALVPIKITR